MTDDGNHRGDGSGDGGRFSFLPASHEPSSPSPARREDHPGRSVSDVDWQAYFSPSGGSGSGDAEEWRRVLDAVRRYKLWIAGAVAVCLLLGVGAAWYFPEIYQAEAKVWVDSSTPEESSATGVDLLNGQGWTAFFESSRVLLPAVDSLDAYLRPVSPQRPEEGLFGDFSLSEGGPEPGLYRLEVDGGDRYRLYRAAWSLPGPLRPLGGLFSLPPESLVETGELGGTVGTAAGFSWRPDAGQLRRAAPVRFAVRLPQDAVQGLRKQLGVEYNPESGLMTLRFQDVRAGRAASTLNLLLDRFTREADSIKRSKLNRVIEDLERRMADADERLESTRQALNENVSGEVRASLSRPGEAGGEQASPLVSDAYARRRTQARELQAELEVLRSTRSRIQAGDTVHVGRLRAVASESWPDGLVGTLSELDSLRSERRRLLRSFTERHPDVRELDQEIARIRTEALPSLIEESVQVLESRHASLQQRVRTERERLRGQASENIRGRELWDAYARAETLHARIAGRLESARLARASRLPAFEVLDRAATPSEPFHSRDRQLLALAALGGLALGLGGALLRDRLDDRIHDPDELRERLGMPFLGVVPSISAPTTSRTSSNEAILSAFRSIRNRVEGLGERPGGIVSVTSPGVGDGKSTVATNLAVSYANTGYRTILVDADIFRGCLHQIFGISRAPGLTDYLLDRASVEQIVHDVDVPGLAVVPAGRPAADGANRMTGPRTDRMLSTLIEACDVVILDTPPLAAGTETALLGEKSDKTALVLRADHTDMKQAEVQLRMLFAHRIPLIGGVLNDVSRSAPYYDYYSAEEYYRALDSAGERRAGRLTAAL